MPWLTSVFFANAQTGWVAGEYGTIGYSTDGGQSWAVQLTPLSTNGTINNIHFSSPTEGWAVGDGGIMLHTTTSGLLGVKSNPNQSIPTGYALYQNYPNPFNPTTVIRFNVPEQSRVVLSIFNVLGQRVQTLVDGVKHAGEYSVTWDPRGLSSGVYFYRLEAGRSTITKKLVLIR
jgi:hypothetical protein